MYFKHPEVLYALFSLLIPIIVHLFKLRKFKKQYFTNVSLIQQIVAKSRKSSQLKKWLLLITRLLLLTSLILAFAEPFFPEKATQAKRDLVVILDNSISMSAQENNISKLEQSKQNLLKQLPKEQNFSLITNTSNYKNITAEDFKSINKDINTSTQAFNLKEINLKLKSFPDNIQIIVISDFYGVPSEDISEFMKTYPDTYFTNMGEANPKNAQIVDVNLSNNQLQVKLKSSQNEVTTSLSLYNSTTLLGKIDVDFSSDKTQNISFDLNDEELESFNLQLTKDYLTYDNVFYGSKSLQKNTQVLIISDENANYIKQVFKTDKQFKVSIKSSQQLELSDFDAADVIISNQLNQIDLNLAENLENALNQSKTIILIPSVKVEAQENYLNLKFLKTSLFSEVENRSQDIININFKHPVFSDVFLSEVKNFDYPTTRVNYNISTNFKSILSYGSSAYFAQKENLFVFASPLKSGESNFYNSPLIVPSLIESALFNQESTALYHFTTQKKPIIIDQAMVNDQVLKLRSSSLSYIPQQQQKASKTELTTNKLDLVPGHYAVTLEKDSIAKLSFNQSREESNLKQPDFESLKIAPATIESHLENYKELTTEDQLWKWFITFAIIFLLIEVAIVRIIN